MKLTQSRKSVILTFSQGCLFWTASSATTGFFPLLAAALYLTTYQTGLFLAGAAIGRAVFQPFAGLLITPDNAARYSLVGLACAVCSSLILAYCHHTGWIIIARLLEGIGVSLFIIGWRTLLNRMKNLNFFDAINESYILSQNIGRVTGPAIGGLLVARFGIQAVFIFPAVQYAMCLFISHHYGIIQPQNKFHRKEQRVVRILNFPQIYWSHKSLLIIHHVEFFCLGLWLASWPIYAVTVNNLTSYQLGYSLTSATIGGIAFFVIKPFTSIISIQKKLSLAFILLLAQPISALFTSHFHLLLGVFFFIGGLGGTVYFTTFHRFLANSYTLEKIPFIYGMLGSSTFLCQAAGQAITPILTDKFSAETAILLDITLLSTCLILTLCLPIKKH